MSIEQILLLLLFIVFPIIQSLLGRRSAEPGEAPQESDAAAARPPPLVSRAPPPVSRAPASPPVRSIEAEPLLAVVPPRHLSAIGARERGRNRHLRELLPRDVRGLRRAVALAEVLGPPRSLTLSPTSSDDTSALLPRALLRPPRRSP